MNGDKAALTICHDCLAKPGEAHDRGCDVAICLQTGGQQIACDEAHDCGTDIWTGETHGTPECIEFGWYAKFSEATGWVRCGPDDPEGSADLNRLHCGEARWDASAGRWRKWETGPHSFLMQGIWFSLTALCGTCGLTIMAGNHGVIVVEDPTTFIFTGEPPQKGTPQ